mmetsp:Transcript_720/g.703  ORF Transcript_720/g.703 Transcript_720/m.703 type:complete len:935 (-) Transcript_720:181-2985(-)
MGKKKLLNIINNLSLLSLTTSQSTNTLLFQETIPTNTLSSVSNHNGPLTPATSFDFINNRGDPTFIVGNFGNSQVDVVVGFYDSAKKVRQLNSPVPSRDGGFGTSIALDNKNNIYVGQVDSVGWGSVFIFDGEYSTWTATQQLSPPTEFFDHSNYGISIDIDPTSYNTLAVGCPNCNSSGYSLGSVYIYESSKIKKTWELKQTLTPVTTYSLGSSFVRIYDDVLLASYLTTADTTPTTHTQVVVSKKGKDAQFIPIQALSIPSNDITSAEIYQDTIVLASSTQNYGSYTNVGLVYIYKSFDPSLPGKPRPTQWSVQQVLSSPSPGDDLKFGNAISINEDRLVVSENSNRYYIYEKRSGSWSQQQVIDNAGANDFVSLYGEGFAASSSSGSLLSYYTPSNDWDCIQISLEDQFGDGWDVASLVIETPSGEKDYFTSRCDLTNPLTIRYCPQRSTDNGLYKLYIADGPKAKFSWEILWRVYEERTGLWFTGDVDSSIDFNWDSSLLQFESKKTHVLPSSINCTLCPQKPTPKPTPPPKPSPHLRKLSHTSHPTHSPAPTLAIDPLVADWEVLTLQTSSSEWFNYKYHGANYYVSDAKGRRLFTTGTLCPSEATDKKCWVNIPDGEYIVRVGGALSSFAADFQWKFCRSANSIPAKTQLLVKIENNECQILSYHERLAYCDNVIGFDYFDIVQIQIVILNVHIDSLSGSDIIVFKEALSSLFNGVSSNDVSIISSTPSYSGSGSVLVTADVAFSHSKTGLALNSVDGIDSLKEIVHNTLENDNGIGLWQRIVSSSQSSNLNSASGVQIVSYMMHGSKDVPITESIDEVQTFIESSNSESSSNDSSSLTENKSKLFAIVGLSSYGILIVVLIGLVVLFIYARPSLQKPSTTETSIVQSTNSRKSVPKSTPVLSASDFQKMVQDEDEVLKMMLANGPRL